MLHQLFIQNYAIIDQLKINFTQHLNIITGETGAGKSILMGALSLILGDRADTAALLDKEQKCIVEGNFKIQSENTSQFLKDNELDDDLDIMIRREIAPSGKSRAFINDTPVTLSQLKELTSMLVDLHRQFDIQEINRSDFQLEVLDALAGNDSILSGYRKLFSEYKNVNQQLAELKGVQETAGKEYDYHKFLFDELVEAGFQENEIEENESALRLMENAESIKSTLLAVGQVLDGSEDAVLQQIRTIVSKLSTISSVMSGLAPFEERLQSVFVELKDITIDIEQLNDKISFNEEKLNELNERMDVAYSLLKKHRVQTTAELLTIKSELNTSLQKTINLESEIEQKEKLLGKLFTDLGKKAKEISSRRSEQIPGFIKKVNKLLQVVGMPGAAFKVELTPLATPASDGSDAVEFLFDANKTNFLPVRKVASGGELSRLMLIIKSLVAKSMQMPTLIFDEIDTGISGEAARQVGNIIKDLSDDHQIILITHQPQIAAKAFTHFFVYKEKKAEKILTNVKLLTGEERIQAIATMLSGDKPTAAAFENAREMMN